MKNQQYYRTLDWFKNNGDETLKINHNLNRNSVVFEIGGYKGDWADQIYQKYKCYVYIFEPITEFYNLLTIRFKGIQKIKIFNFGLSNKNKKVSISDTLDASSQFSKGEKKQLVNLIDIVSFILDNDLKQIDLLNINAEGAEYEILERLINEGEVIKCINIQVQFHDFIPNSSKRMYKIQKELYKSHYLTYQYEFVWENWRKLPTFNKKNIKALIESNKKKDLVSNNNRLSLIENIKSKDKLLSKKDVEIIDLYNKIKNKDLEIINLNGELEKQKKQLNQLNDLIKNLKESSIYKIRKIIIRSFHWIIQSIKQ